MKHVIAHLFIALVFLNLGYLLGGYRGTRQTTMASNAGSLAWFTDIHQRIAKGDHEKAKELTASAVDAHVGVLAQVQNDPQSIFVWIVPWAPDVKSQITPALKQTTAYFVRENSVLKPEPRDFLAETQKIKN